MMWFISQASIVQHIKRGEREKKASVGDLRILLFSGLGNSSSFSLEEKRKDKRITNYQRRQIHKNKIVITFFPINLKRMFVEKELSVYRQSKRIVCIQVEKKNCLYIGREKNYNKIKSICGLVQAAGSIINFYLDHPAFKTFFISSTDKRKKLYN